MECRIVVITGKTVYVLGAGFSKDAGCPLVSEFTAISSINELKRNLRNKLDDLSRFKRVAHYIRDRIDAGYCEDNIESVLNHVAAAKYLSMGSTTERENRKYPAEDMFRDIQWFIVKVLEQKIKPIFPPEYGTFLNEICKEQDTIIIFNYDLVVENVLERLTQPFRYGIENGSTTGRLILKLHGSMNWAYCDACGLRDKVGPAVLPQSNVAPDLYARTINCHQCGSKLEPVLIPPVLYKDGFYQNSEWIRELWIKAYQELSGAQKIFFIGFSMAPTDAYAQELFKLSSNMNKMKGLRYLVINRSRSTKSFQELKKRYRAVLVGDTIQFKRVSFLQYVNQIKDRNNY